jgi:hypothetical protein
LDKVRLLLTLFTIIVIAVPILGIIIAYQGNLLGLFIPPEIKEITDNLSNSGGSNESGFKLPTVVRPIQYDPATRKVTIAFQFTNPFPVGVKINSFSGTVECYSHGTSLGTTTLKEPVMIGAGENKTLTVTAIWTEEAVSHFQNSHPGENTNDINLVDLAIDAGGLRIQSNEPIRINDVPIA